MDCIIYGAGKYAEKAFRCIRRLPEYNVLFFVDKDEKKQGKGMCCGHNVMSPDLLKEYDRSVCVVVGVYDAYSEVCEYLDGLGYENVIRIAGIDYDDSKEIKHLYSELCRDKCIELGRFLETGKKNIRLNELPFIHGGSGLLDYAFLHMLAVRFSLKTYFEIGTYIGTSINIMSEICPKCYGITAPIGSEYSMRKWCIDKGIPDYSSALTGKDNIYMHYCDSKRYDYRNTKDVDLFFIDGDHSYNGVYCDTTNVFNNRKNESIVVWHDFKHAMYGTDVVLAVKDAIGEEFKNVYITDNNICGVYLPEKYQGDLPLTQVGFCENHRPGLYVYDLTITPHRLDV